MQKIVYISVDKLIPHPDNPRKNLGDLTELADSIKAKGVLQNLTVVPAEDDTFRIVIGHRRHAASKLAGLEELPCVVADMTPQEQFETMTIENVQRSDLTVYEQAEAFQIMLDMGRTVEEVAQKTGFSKTTIRNRVKLTELDKTKFQKGEERGATLQDYLRLNEIQDTERRNRVLDTIGTPNFNNNLKSALDDQNYQRELAAFIQTLQEADWCQEQTDEEYGYGSSEYRYYKCFDKWTRKPIPKPKDTDVASYIYKVTERDVTLYRKGPEPEKKQSPEEAKRGKYQRKFEKLEKKLVEITKTHKEMRIEFMQSFMAVNNNEMDILAWAAKVLFYGSSYSSVDVELMGRITGIPVENKKNENVLDAELWNKMLFNQPLKALLCATYASLERYGIRYYTTGYNIDIQKSIAKHTDDYKLNMLYEGLTAIGYEMSDEELQMQNGSHPIFMEIDDLIKAFKKEAKDGKV